MHFRPNATTYGMPVSSVARIRRRFFPIVHAVVPYHSGHTQTVVTENAGAAQPLGVAVGFHLPPTGHGFLVAPKGQRQQTAWLGQALKALNGNEAIHLLQQRTQRCSRLKVGVLLAGRWLNFKDHGHHAAGSWRWAGKPNVPSTPCVNVRSSRRMKRFSCASAKLARPSGSARRRAR